MTPICVQRCVNNLQRRVFQHFRDWLCHRSRPNFDRVTPDLILLDVYLPDGNGIDICQRLRRSGFSKPIAIMLTAKDAGDDIVRGLEAGANDHITKPLRMRELLACIRTQLRQFQKRQMMPGLIFGDLSFVSANKMLHHKGLDKMLSLTEKEAMILKFLYQAFPEDVSKQKILGEVWGYRNGVSSHTLRNACLPATAKNCPSVGPPESLW